MMRRRSSKKKDVVFMVDEKDNEIADKNRLQSELNELTVAQ